MRGRATATGTWRWPSRPRRRCGAATQAAGWPGWTPEHDNLRAALAWSQGAARASRRCAWPAPWPISGTCAAIPPKAAPAWRALERADRRPSRARARALHWLGGLDVMVGEPGLGPALVEESIAVSRAIGDARTLATALRHRALDAGHAGYTDPDAERTALEAALAAARAAGDEREVGMDLTSLANRAWRAGDREAAAGMFGRSPSGAAPRRRVGGPELEPALIGQRGAPGESVEDARSVLDEAAALAEEMNFAWVRAETQLGLGDLARAGGDPAAAARRYRAALLLGRDRVGAFQVRRALRAIASLRTSVGDHARAARLFGAEETLRWVGAEVRHGLAEERHEADLAATRGALGARSRPPGPTGRR